MYSNIKSVRYKDLRGVDFSRPDTMVDKNHSPDCLNMMPDSSINPVKRPGWKTEYSVGAKVHNIWFCTLGGQKLMLCHAGTAIYKLTDGEAAVIKTGVSDSQGCGFYAVSGDKGYFYILTGGEYLRYDGTAVEDVTDCGYVPMTSIAKAPSGGGESYEDINMLSAKRREGFIGTENDLIYQLGEDGIDGVDKVEIMQSDGSYITLTAQTDYTADLTLGKVTFVTARPAPLSGHDNIIITYSKTVEGYSEKIEKCTIAAKFGLGGENKVFLSGNPDCSNRDFHSSVYNPEYFPDLNYAVVGNSQTAVMGYLKLGENMGIIKQSNSQDTSLFLRTVTLREDKAEFSLQGGISSVGAVSKDCFALLNDESLFLSGRGIFAVVSSSITGEKVVVNRSGRVDAKLTGETDLSSAVACVWKDFYILSVNGNCYLLDSRQLVDRENGEKNSKYEAYFWNNVPAVCFAVDENSLWFGTADGKICRFKDVNEGKSCYSDDGEAICARWSTALDDEGCVERFKTLQRKGCLVVLKPYDASSCDVYFKVDSNKKEHICNAVMDITTAFKYIDFSRFTFYTDTNPRELYFLTRKKRYKRLQMIFENNKVNEGFGIEEIIKSYKVTGYSKNRR